MIHGALGSLGIDRFPEACSAQMPPLVEFLALGIDYACTRFVGEDAGLSDGIDVQSIGQHIDFQGHDRLLDVRNAERFILAKGELKAVLQDLFVVFVV